ncbi:MAG: glycosyltransferase, partial [Bradyrhizobiaceae bacterium]|nr:glycosyltransferase [Bradyrhizobiaceae bacterium]
IGVFDAELEQAMPQVRPAHGLCAFWDMDAPATLDAIAADPTHHLRDVVPRYDVVLACGGGALAVNGYDRLGARLCVPLHNALDPATHFPAPGRLNYRCDLSFLADRRCDREARVDTFFVRPATILRHHSFLLGGAGWHGKILPANVRCVGHIRVDHHNCFFGSGLATLNVGRDSMVRYGYSPPARLFEAVGAGACLITDAREGIADFLEPDREVLVAADGEEVAELLAHLTPEDARTIAAAARARILAHHTYEHRAREVDAVLAAMTHEVAA